jgi:hypothetical protein
MVVVTDPFTPNAIVKGKLLKGPKAFQSFVEAA